MSEKALVKVETAIKQFTVSDILEQANFIQEITQKAMKEGEHYGKIPGCGDKKVLKKPGAEKLGLTFRLVPKYQIDETSLLNDHLKVITDCSLYHAETGNFIGMGTGSCSTMETKYRYRDSQRKCPTCGEPAIIKGKEEYGGGWLCFKKKGGCGAKFVDDDQLITKQKVGKIENPNIADEWNTVRKISKKRAYVDSMITALAASDSFDQDVDDMAENGNFVAKKQDGPEPTNQTESNGTIGSSGWLELKNFMGTVQNPEGQFFNDSPLWGEIVKIFEVTAPTELTNSQSELIAGIWKELWISGEWDNASREIKLGKK